MDSVVMDNGQGAMNQLTALANAIEYMTGINPIARITELKRQRAELIDALEDVQALFDWGDFKIDFSNGIVMNGIDEGDIKGNNALNKILDKVDKALSAAKDN